jgi:hypothetical protein
VAQGDDPTGLVPDLARGSAVLVPRRAEEALEMEECRSNHEMPSCTICARST